MAQPLAVRVAVGGIAFDEQDHVLLIRRGHEPGRGLWTVPGGHVELGEALHAAVTRELHEETGLEVEVGPQVELLERIGRDPAGAVTYHFVIIDFLVRIVGGVLAAGEDAADARFVGLAELAELPHTEGLLPVLQRALALARGAR
jgi:ADP-ribose pyrophosphatase YjhB (NUDIX family)